jgi:beta-glucosidase
MKGRTYRYVQQDQVLFPFGFGLSYASFSYALEEAKMQEDGSVLVQGRVRNTSSVDSRHVIQLYLAGECPDLPPHPVLAGFASLFLPAGQELTHTFLLKEAQFTAVNQEGQRYAVKGRFHLSFGGSQGDELSQRLGAAPVSHTTFIR